MKILKFKVSNKNINATELGKLFHFLVLNTVKWPVDTCS